MQALNYTIRGLTPLIMHKPPDLARGCVGYGAKRVPPDVAAAAEAAAYRQEDGTFCYPALAFKWVIICAARDYYAGGTPSKGRRPRRSKLTSHLQVGPTESLPLFDENGPLRHYVIDSRRAGSFALHRPKLPAWMAKLEVRVEDGLFPPGASPRAEIEQLLTYGGRRIGVGGNRVAMNGWFGQFEVLPA